jgi:hypothetical protein
LARSPLIHNLTALLERVADAGGDVEPFLALEAFTVFAVQFRYDAEPEPMELDRRDWQQRAVELVDHVELIVRRGC